MKKLNRKKKLNLKDLGDLEGLENQKVDEVLFQEQTKRGVILSHKLDIQILLEEVVKLITE